MIRRSSIRGCRGSVQTEACDSLRMQRWASRVLIPAVDAVGKTSGPTGATVVPCSDLLVMPGYELLLQANHLDSVNALFAVADGELLGKPGLAPWRERLRLRLEDRSGQRVFFLKRFRYPPAKARREMRRSGSGASSLAGMEWTWMTQLAREGIPCVQPVAYGEELDGSRELRSAILTAAVPGHALEHWVGRWGEADRPTVRNLIAPVAQLVARLHACGWVHRDLYLSHVFYEWSEPGEESLHLIDLQRIIRPRWRRRRWIVKDLAALNFSSPISVVSTTDRMRWLKTYLGVEKLDPAARRLIYRIVAKTRRIARHERHRLGGVGTVALG